MRFEGKKARPLADAGVHGMSALYRMYEDCGGVGVPGVRAREGVGAAEGCAERRMG